MSRAKDERAAPTQGVLHNRARRGVKRGAALAAHAAEVYERLAKEHPDAHCELDHRTPLELLCATILSAQCTDKRVNMVTPTLFARYPSAAALAEARSEDLEEIIRSTGFFRNKTKSLLGMSGAVVERHRGEVPSTMEELVRLPGVGRKTANVVLGNAFGKAEGIVVDTHVARLSERLGLTREIGPVKIEDALIALYPRDRWTMLSHLLIFHGRRICEARTPKCGECVLNDICPSARVPRPAAAGKARAGRITPNSRTSATSTAGVRATPDGARRVEEGRTDRTATAGRASQQKSTKGGGRTAAPTPRQRPRRPG